ncbi:hypothetical protein Tco_0315717 [Tanacetum coccineum]
MLTEVKLTKDDEADFVDSSKYRGEIMPQINQKDYQLTKACLRRIHRSKAMDEEVRESYRHLESRLFHEGRFVTPSFIKEFKNKSNGPMTFVMRLTRLYSHILRTNSQAIVPPNRFTFHDRVMNPLDILMNPIKEKVKRVTSPSVSSSSSSSSDGNEAPSFLEFYEKLFDNEDLTDAQREKRGMFKCLNRYFGTIIKYLKNQK